ncbi:MAG: phage terminase family protein [Bacteroidota bacterium]|nr:phage terminase family protein [Bacteroidota bacterium]
MTLSNTAYPQEYAKFRDAVLNGDIPVNQYVSMQMNRIDRLIASPDYYYDDEAINGFIEFAENEMTLTDGSDLTLLPSFKLWAEDLLSWFYYSDEVVYDQELRRNVTVTVLKRLVNKQYLIVGRGAAKSVYDSLMQAYFLVIDPDTTHQIVTAPTMKLAEETMSPIRTAISRSRGPLMKFMTSGSVKANGQAKQMLASTKKGIENFLTNSLIEIRPMKIDKLQGLRSKYNTIDEWLSGKISEDVIGAIEQGASKVQDYVIISTSSEGTVRNGVGDTIKMELVDILRGDYEDPHSSIWYYRLDDVQEVNQPEMWMKANPNIGATVSYDAYQRGVALAEAQPTKRNDILAKRFGIPVEGFTYFFTYEDTIPHQRQNFDGMTAALGADLSQGDDFTAFTFLFPLGEHGFGVKTLSFVSAQRVAKLPQATQLKYEEFVKEGTLIIKDSTVLDMDEVFDDLDDFILEHNYDISAFGYDPYNATHFAERWATENSSFGMVRVRQGARTESAPLGELKHLAEARELIFDEQLMMFAMGNAIAIEDNNGNYKLSKQRAIEKIDNVAALLDAWVAYKDNREAFE